MALLKLGAFITQMSGKLGGQVVSTTRNGTVLKNIVQPPQQASTLQSYQRTLTAGLTNGWQFLSQTQRNTFIAASVNYQWVNRVGETVTRNGFQTYCFINQNLHAIGQPQINIAPAYIPVLKPTVQDISTGIKEFLVDATNVNSSYLYLVFCQLHYSIGARSFTPDPVIIDICSSTDLTTGKNFAPIIKNYFQLEPGFYSATLEFCAINSTTGNRDLSPPRLVKTFEVGGLGLDILSYYPFNGNANDFFGVNNATYIGATFNNSGLVGGSAVFSGLASSYINLGNNNSFNFCNISTAFPFTIMFWVNETVKKTRFYLTKRNGLPLGNAGTWQLLKNQNKLANGIADTSFSNRVENFQAVSDSLNTWNHICMVYTPDNTLVSYINGSLYDTTQQTGSFNRIQPNNVSVTVGGLLNAGFFNMVGSMCELTFFNQALTLQQINAIITANLNGQSIIDIN